jgi:hypothetical protein
LNYPMSLETANGMHGAGEPGISLSESVNLVQAEEIMARAVAASSVLNNRAFMDAGINASSGIE